MFNIVIPVTKAKRSTTKNVLEVEGIASDPSIDRDNERFSAEAVKKMAEHVANGEIPIRVEHENKFYSDIWIWKEAKIIDDKLRVKGEIDLDYSFWKDLAVLFDKWKSVALSVWGRVLDASFEYVKEIWKMVKTYTDVILSEISIVKNPSNYNASLSIAKSFDVDKKQDTTEGQKIIAYYKSLYSLPKVTEMKQTFEDIIKSFEEDVAKCCESVCDTNYCAPQGMTTNDIKIVSTLVKAIEEIGTDKIDRPKELEDWEMIDKLPWESFVLDIGDSRMYPHHNADFTINKKWLDYQLSKLLSGETRLGTKDFWVALNHLYHHYKEETMKKTAKDVVKTEEAKAEVVVDETTAETAPVIGNEEIELMAKCYSFYTKEITDRPQVNWNDLSDREVKKVAEAYRAMMERKRHKGSLGMQMAGAFHSEATATKPAGSTAGQEAVNKDESLSNNDDKMKVIKNTDEANDTPVVEEAVDASINPVEETPEVTPEVTEEVEVTKSEGETEEVIETPEVAEEVTTEDAVAEEVAEEVVAEDVEKAAPVTPGKKMSDHNAKRQARESVTVKAEDIATMEWDKTPAKVKKEEGTEEVVEESIVDKVDQLAKSLDEDVVVEAPVTEEAVVETPEVVAEEVVETPEVVAEVVEETEKAKKTSDNDEDDKEEKGCGVKKTATDIALEKLTAFLMDSVVPMVKSMQKSLNSLQDEVAKSQTLTKSFQEDSLSNITKSYDELKANVGQISNIVEVIAKSASPRKSVANFVAMEKSFSKDAENVDQAEQITKKMDEGMSYAEARTFVIKSQQ
jgi:hypothetical protein